MPKRPEGHVFLKVDLPEDLYARFQRVCEQMTGKSRSVSQIMREMVLVVVEDVEKNGPVEEDTCLRN